MPLHPRHRSWTEEETDRLRAHIARGGSATRAAVMFHRTQGAVRAHAAACGLKFPTISELRRRASGASSAANTQSTLLAQAENKLRPGRHRVGVGMHAPDVSNGLGDDRR